MKNLKQIAEENHLTYNVTDIKSQGEENEVLYGFKSYDQAEEIAKENGLTLYYIRTDFDPESDNDKKLRWNVKKPADGELIIDNDFLFELYGPVHDFRAFDSRSDFEYDVLEHIKDEDCKLDTIEKMINFLDDADSLSKYGFTDSYTAYVVVMDCTGDNWNRIDVYKRECIQFDDHYNGDFKVFLVAIKEDMREGSIWSTNVVANLDRLTEKSASAADLKDETGEHKYELDDVTRDIIKNSKRINGYCYESFSEDHPTSLVRTNNPFYGKNVVTEEDFFAILSTLAQNMKDEYYSGRANFAEGYGCVNFDKLKLMAVEFIQCKNGTTRIILDIE